MDILQQCVFWQWDAQQPDDRNHMGSLHRHPGPGPSVRTHTHLHSIIISNQVCCVKCENYHLIGKKVKSPIFVVVYLSV